MVVMIIAVFITGHYYSLYVLMLHFLSDLVCYNVNSLLMSFVCSNIM